MRHHLALQAEERGSADAASRQFGNIALLKEDSRAMWTWRLAEQVVQDIRYAVRTMSANSLFTAMAVLSLALGTGANTAIYSFMDAILLRLARRAAVADGERHALSLRRPAGISGRVLEHPVDHVAAE